MRYAFACGAIFGFMSAVVLVILELAVEGIRQRRAKLEHQNWLERAHYETECDYAMRSPVKEQSVKGWRV